MPNTPTDSNKPNSTNKESGEIIFWKEQQGYGFIQRKNELGTLFIHISAINNASRTPIKGDIIYFQVTKDEKDKSAATNASIEGLSLLKSHQALSDFSAHIIAITLLSILAIITYIQQHPTPLLFSIPALSILTSIIVILLRPKTPKEKGFVCASCKQQSQHGERTIAAWNTGLSRFFCKECHNKWLKKQQNIPVEQQFTTNYFLNSYIALIALWIALIAF